MFKQYDSNDYYENDYVTTPQIDNTTLLFAALVLPLIPTMLIILLGAI